MITYSVNKWGFCAKIFSLRGSVFPKAIIWAIPCAAAAVGVWWYQNHDGGLDDKETESVRRHVASQILNGFTAVLGFLLIFRTQKAYGRYWECAMYLQKARGEWFNACSNLTTFTSPKPEKQHDTKMFVQKLVRLTSLLFCSAIGEVCSMEDPAFEVIDPLMSQESMGYLLSKPNCFRCEIVMQWIQRLVVDNVRTNTIDIAPPIVSRVFQEFSLGIVNIAAAKKITIIPFPFPYSQMMQFLLMFQALVVPALSGYSMFNHWGAALQTFTIIFLTWCIHFIAMEIEMPFGDDDNDLPLSELITNMNDSLTNLMDKQVQAVPPFRLSEEVLVRGLIPEDRIPFKHGDSQGTEAKGGASSKVDPVKPGGTPAKPQSVNASAAPPGTPRGQPMTAQPSAAPMAPAPSTASAAPQSAALSGEAVTRLAQMSASIEGHLAQIGQHPFPRIEERLDRIGSELTQITKCSLRYMERTERLDKASLGRPPIDSPDSHLWFCGERQAAELATMEDNGNYARPAPSSKFPAPAGALGR